MQGAERRADCSLVASVEVGPELQKDEEGEAETMENDTAAEKSAKPNKEGKAKAAKASAADDKEGSGDDQEEAGDGFISF